MDFSSTVSLSVDHALYDRRGVELFNRNFEVTPMEQLEPQLTEPWMDEANCRGKDPEIFILDKGQSALPAKMMCRNCVVVEDCLEYALANRERGVWGNTTEGERKRIRRERR